MSKKMLIVDNEEANRRLLRLVLENDGCHCVEAENGPAGLSLLESQDFDVVILDNGMPGMTGMEFLNRLPHLSHNQNIPVIMVTGWIYPEMRETVTQLGAYAILEKPYDFGELLPMVTQLCPAPGSPHSRLSVAR
jgi:CheY-like chemotaxis protein